MGAAEICISRLGPFGESSHEVRIPLRAVGNIDTHMIALTHQLLLQIATNAIEHLELKGISADAVIACIFAGGLNDGFIMAGNGGKVREPSIRSTGNAKQTTAGCGATLISGCRWRIVCR